MTNNKNRGDKTSIPANRIIPRQDALTRPLNTNKLVEPIGIEPRRPKAGSLLKGRFDSPGRALGLSAPPHGGADRDRTGDLLLAKQALSQLSYGPNNGGPG